MNIQWPDKITKKVFLKEYWQKKPLFIKNAFPELNELISANELAGLACEQDIESRILILDTKKDKWSVEHGPFKEKRFNKLPKSHWTLLVQDVDKHIPEAQDLLKCFEFLPKWRLDDLMISYAEDQGSVGAHFDHYDVFLVQLSGQRLWKISDEKYSDDDLIPDCEVKLLNNFKMTNEWLVETGDLLYLPPNVAHWGISQGECLTGSIGFVSPRQDMLFNTWADDIGEHLNTNKYFSDPDLSPTTSTHQSSKITHETLAQLTKMLIECIDTQPEYLSSLFGKMISDPKANLNIEPLSKREVIDKETFYKQQKSQIIFRHSYLRLFYVEAMNGDIKLFGNGKEYVFNKGSDQFIELLCDNTEYPPEFFERFIKEENILEFLVTFYNQGFIFFDDE